MAQDINNARVITQAFLNKEEVRELYGQIAWLYDAFTDFEPAHHRRAVDLAAIQPNETVLEVACGTGRATLEIARRMGKAGDFYAVDLTPGMLERARRRLARAGLLERVDLRLGDAFELPYPDAAFDVLYNAYMLDLVDTDDIPVIMAEFARVLKPGGRLVLVDMSKNREGKTLYELLYEKGLLGFASGGCRPVQAVPFLERAEFRDIQRIYRKNRSLFFMNWLTGTEIVIAVK